MAANKLNLQQQLAVCRQVARLVRAKLPLVGALGKSSNTVQSLAGEAETEAAAGSNLTSGSNTDPADVVEKRLASGKSLSQALAADDSRDSRILAACIEAGELAGALDRTLESWSSMHMANSKSAKAMRVAMLYPCMLIATTVIALAFVVWLIIPEYRATYELFDQRLPAWLETLVWIREHQWLLILVVLLACVAPLVIWYVRRQQLASSGLPREPVRKARQQALSTEVAAIMLEGLVPLNKVASLAAQAGGGPRADVQHAFRRLQRQQLVTPLAPETSMLLASLHVGLLECDSATEKLHQVAAHFRSTADIQARRQTRWVPMLVALTVGLVTVLTYVFIIYLPWIWLLRQIVQPTTTTGL